MRSRLLALAVAGLLICGTTAGAIAGGGGDDHGQNAACTQYKPGNGFGDKNHIHTGPPGQTGENPCDKDDHGQGEGQGDNDKDNHGGKGDNDNDNGNGGDHDSGHGHGH